MDHDSSIYQHNLQRYRLRHLWDKPRDGQCLDVLPILHSQQKLFSLVFGVGGYTEQQWAGACYLYLRCWVRLSLAFFSGRQTGQSCRVQFFQGEMICLDDAQWATAGKRRQRDREINRVYNLAGLSLPCVVNTKYLTLSLLGWEVVLPTSKGNSSHFSDNFYAKLLYVYWP